MSTCLMRIKTLLDGHQDDQWGHIQGKCRVWCFVWATIVVPLEDRIYLGVDLRILTPIMRDIHEEI